MQSRPLSECGGERFVGFQTWQEVSMPERSKKRNIIDSNTPSVRIPGNRRPVKYSVESLLKPDDAGIYLTGCPGFPDSTQPSFNVARPERSTAHDQHLSIWIRWRLPSID
jgi:hypothetical protein